MITVKQFREAGFTIALGDNIKRDPSRPFSEVSLESDYIIESCDWRDNEGEQPVSDDCEVLAQFRDGERRVIVAGNAQWRIPPKGHMTPLDIIKWQPHLPAIELKWSDLSDALVNSLTEDSFNELRKLGADAIEAEIDTTPAQIESLAEFNPQDFLTCKESQDAYRQMSAEQTLIDMGLEWIDGKWQKPKLVYDHVIIHGTLVPTHECTSGRYIKVESGNGTFFTAFVDGAKFYTKDGVAK